MMSIRIPSEMEVPQHYELLTLLRGVVKKNGYFTVRLTSLQIIIK